MDNEQTGAPAPVASVPLTVDWQAVCVILMARYLPLGARSITIKDDEVMGMAKGDYAPHGPVLAVRPTAPDSLTISLHTREEAEEIARQYDATRQRAANDPASVAPVSDRVQ